MTPRSAPSQTLEKKPKRKSWTDEDQLVWDSWAQITGHTQMRLTAKRRRRVSALRKRLGSPQRCADLFEVIMASRHHAGKYDTWETAPLRDVDKSEAFLLAADPSRCARHVELTDEGIPF